MENVVAKLQRLLFFFFDITHRLWSISGSDDSLLLSPTALVFCRFLQGPASQVSKGDIRRFTSQDAVTRSPNQIFDDRPGMLTGYH